MSLQINLFLSSLVFRQAIFSVILAYRTLQTDLSTLYMLRRYSVWGWGMRISCLLPTALQLNRFSCSQGRKVSHSSQRLHLIHLEQPWGRRDGLFWCPAWGLPKVWCVQTNQLIFCHKCQKDWSIWHIEQWISKLAFWASLKVQACLKRFVCLIMKAIRFDTTSIK